MSSTVTLRFNLTTSTENEKDLLDLHQTVMDAVKANDKLSHAHVALNYTQSTEPREGGQHRGGTYRGRGGRYLGYRQSGRGRRYDNSGQQREVADEKSN